MTERPVNIPPEFTKMKHYKSMDITIDDIKKAIEKLPEQKKILARVEICNKHWKKFREYLPLKEDWKETNPLFGVGVVIRPYIKKVKLYFKYL